MSLTPAIVNVSLGALGGTLWEQRQRSISGRPIGERCVVTVPSEDALLTLVFVVRSAGGTIEGNPAQLAGGMRLPEEGVLLSFSFPADPVATLGTPRAVIDITESGQP